MSSGRTADITERQAAEQRAVQRRNGADEFLTPREAAAILRVPRQRIYQWLKLGRLRGEQDGRCWRVLAGDVEAALRPHEEQRARLDRALEQVHRSLPADITAQEIEADVSAAFAEARAENRARGR